MIQITLITLYNACVVVEWIQLADLQALKQRGAIKNTLYWICFFTKTTNLNNQGSRQLPVLSDVV